MSLSDSERLSMCTSASPGMEFFQPLGNANDGHLPAQIQQSKAFMAALSVASTVIVTSWG